MGNARTLGVVVVIDLAVLRSPVVRSGRAACRGQRCDGVGVMRIVKCNDQLLDTYTCECIEL